MIFWQDRHETLNPEGFASNHAAPAKFTGDRNIDLAIAQHLPLLGGMHVAQRNCYSRPLFAKTAHCDRNIRKHYA